MIDVENKIINDVFTTLRSSFSGITCYGEYVPLPAAFPCVTLYERDSRTYEESLDDANVEHQSIVTYEANIYSDKAVGKKDEAKQIASALDDVMLGLKFTRIMRDQIPNQDRTIYRITARYRAIVGEPITTEDDTTTYQVYRQ